MEVGEVQRQLEKERFLLVGSLHDLRDLQMEMKLELEKIHPGASQEQMDVALAHLARLDASTGSNVADVAAAVAAQLGGQLDAHAGKYEQLVRDGLQLSCDKMDRLEKVLLENAGSNAAMLAGKVDQHGALIAGTQELHGAALAEIIAGNKKILLALARKKEKEKLEKLKARKKEKEKLEKLKSGVQSSADSFEAQFEYAPCTAEEWDDNGILISGGVMERSELGEGSFATTYSMSAINGATKGVESGQLVAVKMVSSLHHLVLDLVW